MMKMLIKLDELKVKTDGEYDLADMWRIIDAKFEKACTKEVQSDGSRMYAGIASQDYYTKINVATMVLKKQPWFAKYCTKWVWYDNDSDESLPFQNIDVLSQCRGNNPLFMA